MIQFERGVIDDVIGLTGSSQRAWTAIVLSAGLMTGCAPLVDMDEPSANGPRISHLRFVPSGTRAGCSVDVKFRLETSMEDIVSAKGAWVRRRGRIAEYGRSTFPLELDAVGAAHTEELEGSFTPSESGTYYYSVQVVDRSGRMSNVLHGTLAVDRAWTAPAPPCPAEEQHSD